MQIVFSDVFSHRLTRLRCFGWVLFGSNVFLPLKRMFSSLKTTTKKNNNKLNEFTI